LESEAASRQREAKILMELHDEIDSRFPQNGPYAVIRGKFAEVESPSKLKTEKITGAKKLLAPESVIISE